MNATLSIEISEAALADAFKGVLTTAQGLVAPVQAAMTARYGEIVRSNFGQSGMDRPNAWPPLSPRYARKVGRAYATLFVTGALFDAVRVDTDAGRVSISENDCVYALVHQFGGGNNVPARGYFPMLASGEATPWTKSQVLEAARGAVLRNL